MKKQTADLLRLELTAYLCRRNVLRMIEVGHHGHFGGAFSGVDIVTALYFYKKFRCMNSSS